MAKNDVQPVLFISRNPLVIATDQGPFLRQDGNNAMTGTLTLENKLVLSTLTNSALATGANASLDIGSAVLVRVSGPSGAFSIAGIAGGSEGRLLMLQNSTGYSMEILDESGMDGTPENRILTGKGGSVTITNNPGVAKFIYDETASRWIYTGGN